MTVAQRILMASKVIGHIEKNGTVQIGGSYKYQSWDEVLPAVRDACVDTGIQITSSFQVLSHERLQIQGKLDRNRFTVLGTFEVRATDTDEKITFQWPGESEDTGDKGLQKAITSATKYAYLKFFMIPISEDEDGDAVVQEPIRSHQKVTVESAAAGLRDKGWNLFTGLSGTQQQFLRLEAELKKAVGLPVGQFLVQAIEENGCSDLQSIYDYAVSAFKIDTPFIIGGSAS
jgi:hypothetical protein